MARKLTTKAVENFKPGPQRQEISDGGSGLYLVVQPSGAKSWAVRYRHAGKPTKLTLGPWPALTLAAARKGAADALHDLAMGVDPSGSKKVAKQQAAENEANTVAAICNEFLQRERKRLRTISQYERTLQRLVYPAIGGRPVDSLKRSEIVRLLDGVEDSSGSRMADVTLATLRRVFNWHAARSDEFRSPIVRGMNRQNPVEHRRSRILDDDELRKLWATTAGNEQPLHALMRFLLLTAARRNEAAGMRWAEIADGVWTLPASGSKNKIEIIRPLSQAAKEVLGGQPNRNEWVFVGPSGRPLQSFSKAKAQIDAAAGLSDYRLHDLRRTARSLLSRAGISAEVAERCLGHAPPAIVATYNRYEYRSELLHAFEALAGLIERIVNPTDRVVAIRR
jgi:integrase